MTRKSVAELRVIVFRLCADATARGMFAENTQSGNVAAARIDQSWQRD